ncbi:UDP-N-acetylmuramoyl-L-alanyl-D-glutamate--2,6-diaminopimelate ligase [Sulfuritalea sp.]|uniref:Mur ligase family protein n=1 Tax=Sulfuritalea sp. TaxID=2480090 RepID=UPI001AD54402|nr:UDP-N-acetylmuramoyl-L-alanyl-D-glutamate--2,6-diaminopimelate ligase [Sulfuritalea sp.]MBN8475872.1 UDP-N-acetylmuramoyl-L-alanyl-D-glutamate--2,6-diaminopimelate ligase [Sulfuritalea sp.]
MTTLEQLRAKGVTPTRLTADSRRVQPGDIFVALPGAHVDGRDFIAQAVARGAAAVLVEAGGGVAAKVGAGDTAMVAVEGLAALSGEIAHIVYGRPSEKLWVAGITGTNGKTSISQWIAQAMDALPSLPPGRPKAETALRMESPGDEPPSSLSMGRRRGFAEHGSAPPQPAGCAKPAVGQGLGERLHRCAVVGTLGNGFVDALAESPNTTPDAITLHAALAGFVERGAQACAMEVSSIGLDQGRVNGVAFDVAVFTNLTRDHLEYHGSLEAYAAAKARLFAMPGLGAAVFNLDDAFGIELARRLRGRVPTLGYTLGDAATECDEVLRARNLRMGAAGIEFDLRGATIAAPVVGRFNASNLLAVAGALLSRGEGLDTIARALRGIRPPPGRMQALGGHGHPLVVVDYAHTPDALEKALGVLRETADARGGQLVCVFGCGGERDPGKRPQMGAIAERLADRVLVTSDNPRGEDPDAIIGAILSGMKHEAPVQADRARAVADALVAADARDVILLAGKGHEPYQEIAGTRHPYSDLDAAKSALAARR